MTTKYKYGDTVTIENGVTGKVFGVNGDCIFVCVPDERSTVALVYTTQMLDELSTGLSLTTDTGTDTIKESQDY